MRCCQSYTSNLAQKASRYCVLLMICFILSVPATALRAAETHRSASMQASTSEAARQEAIKSVPLKKIHPKHRRQVHKVLTDSSLYRRLPTQVVDCDPDLFTFVAKNPEVLVEMWREMGISRVSLQRTGANSFLLSDNAGTTGKLVIVEQQCDPDAQNRVVMYCEGAYEGKPFKRPIRAQCVLVLRSGSLRETNGRDYVACRIDTFIRIERASIELFAKAMTHLVGRTADINFRDTMNFVSNLSQAAEKKPATIERLVNSLQRVSTQRQQQLVNITYHCAEKYDTKPERVARKPKRSR